MKPASVRVNDSALQQRIVRDYLAFHEATFAWAEQLSVKTLGYEPKQILLLHASDLEADHIGELLDLLRKRGYSFVTLHDALSDHAYSLPDTYVGEEGASWLEHWSISQGKIPALAPQFPQWVIERSKELHLSTGDVEAETAKQQPSQ
jgi:peptidoglycan-N-acetylglucosamine deacetylase